jgi:hypothetical protein
MKTDSVLNQAPYHEDLRVSGGTASRILNFGSRYRLVVSFTPRPLYSLGKYPGTPWIGGWVIPRTGLKATAKKTFLPLPGIETRPTFINRLALNISSSSSSSLSSS